MALAPRSEGAASLARPAVFLAPFSRGFRSISADFTSAPQVCCRPVKLLKDWRKSSFRSLVDRQIDKGPKLLLNDDFASKPEAIHLVIGRRPYAAFGNSTGDRQMLEYTKAGDGSRLAMLVSHDDAKREYAYGPAFGLPDTKVGTFTQTLSDEAGEQGWVVISMKNDWKRVFAFEQ